MTWWREGSIYQVYPRSFQDASGDGAGDLEGVRTRLPYLARLGVDAVWLSPFYRSPMVDFGYDVSEHEDVDPLFGVLRTAIDWPLTRALGLRLILDLFPTHTSEQHRWFASGERRDWYLWRRADQPVERVRRSRLDLARGGGAFYYHAYLPQQPDLNWRNLAVREVMAGVLRFLFSSSEGSWRRGRPRACWMQPRWLT